MKKSWLTTSDILKHQIFYHDLWQPEAIPLFDNLESDRLHKFGIERKPKISTSFGNSGIHIFAKKSGA